MENQKELFEANGNMNGMDLGDGEDFQLGMR